MSYGEFSFSDVLEKFSLTTDERMGIFADVPELEPSPFLKQALANYFPFLRPSDNEKIRSEALIFPLLADLRTLLSQPINLFSGIEFNVDASLFLVLPDPEAEKRNEPKPNKLGFWQKYRITNDDVRRYHQKKAS